MFQKEKLTDLLDLLCNGEITAEQHVELEQILLESDNARDHYLNYIDTHLRVVTLAEMGRFDPENSISSITAAAGEVDAEARVHAEGFVQKRKAKSDSPSKLHEIVSSVTHSYLTWRLATFTLAVVFATLMVGNLNWFSQLEPDHLDLASNGGPVSEGAVENDEPLSTTSTDSVVYVAQVTAMTEDVQWAKDSSAQEFLLRVKENDRLEMIKGLVKVNFFSGASLLLQGPCSFTPTGTNSGHIDSGSLTGKVEFGNFTITTPSARVFDIGTEFGISVDKQENTNVCVFEGEVEVSTQKPDGMVASQLLKQGMAINAVRGGEITTTNVSNVGFVREFPRSSFASTEQFSLVEAMNYDEGGYYRQANAIAADSGEIYEQSFLETEEAYRRQRRGTYHTLRWHPLVDGVFIPSNQGKQVQCNSSGQLIDLVPNGAKTSGPIWSRRRLEGDSKVVFHQNFWGLRTRTRVLERLQRCEHGMIGIHANAGITFDLESIRRHCGRDISKLRMIVSNLDNSDFAPPIDPQERRHVADFRVYTNGNMRQSRLAFGRTDGEMQIEVTIKKSDRFLTFVSTDSGHYWYDQVVIIDPLLILVPPSQVATGPTHESAPESKPNYKSRERNNLSVMRSRNEFYTSITKRN